MQHNKVVYFYCPAQIAAIKNHSDYCWERKFMGSNTIRAVLPQSWLCLKSYNSACYPLTPVPNPS